MWTSCKNFSKKTSRLCVNTFIRRREEVVTDNPLCTYEVSMMALSLPLIGFFRLILSVFIRLRDEVVTHNTFWPDTTSLTQRQWCLPLPRNGFVRLALFVRLGEEISTRNIFCTDDYQRWLRLSLWRRSLITARTNPIKKSVSSFDKNRNFFFHIFETCLVLKLIPLLLSF